MMQQTKLNANKNFLERSFAETWMAQSHAIKAVFRKFARVICTENSLKRFTD